mgnify:CR=1 FL=1
MSNNQEYFSRELNISGHHFNKQVMKKNEPERIVQKDNHAFDAIKYLIQTHPAGPDGAEIWDSMTKEQKVKYMKLKKKYKA